MPLPPKAQEALAEAAAARTARPLAVLAGVAALLVVLAGAGGENWKASNGTISGLIDVKTRLGFHSGSLDMVVHAPNTTHHKAAQAVPTVPTITLAFEVAPFSCTPSLEEQIGNRTYSVPSSASPLLALSTGDCNRYRAASTAVLVGGPACALAASAFAALGARPDAGTADARAAAAGGGLVMLLLAFFTTFAGWVGFPTLDTIVSSACSFEEMSVAAGGSLPPGTTIPCKENNYFSWGFYSLVGATALSLAALALAALAARKAAREVNARGDGYATL